MTATKSEVEKIHGSILPSDFSDCLEAWHFLRGLSADYPQIETWYRTRVTPGITLGTRKLIVLRRHSDVAAIGIAKNEDGEKKICTVRVAARYEGLGLGLRIFEGCLEWLETSRPVLSVSTRNFGKFRRIFEHYSFVHTSTRPGLYLPNVEELFFNEPHELQ